MAVAQDKDAEEDKTYWDNVIKLSFITTSGNTDTSSFAGALDSEAGSGRHSFFGDAFYSYVETNNVESANKLKLDLRYEFDVDPNWFWLFRSGFVRDRFSGYEYRLNLGPGLGYNHWNEENRVLKFFGSLLFRQDDFDLDSGDVASESNTLFSFRNDFEYQLSDTARITNVFEYLATLDEMEDYQLQNFSELAVKLNGNLSLGVSYKIEYQNRPPSDEIEDTDTTFLTSLIIDF